MKMNDLTGKRFGRLIAVSYQSKESGNRQRIFWKCQCDCGNSTNVDTSVLTRNIVKSCGCLRIEVTRKRSLKHGGRIGHKGNREYRAWSGAKNRCYNPNSHKYKNYGERGIKMCERWLNDFGNFFKDMGKCPDGLTLDRIDVNGDYEPNNCHWTTSMVQGRHRTDNVWITYKNKMMILTDWAKELNITRTILYKWLKKGKPIDALARKLNYE